MSVGNAAGFFGTFVLTYRSTRRHMSRTTLTVKQNTGSGI
jgi:hypothetical protein